MISPATDWSRTLKGAPTSDSERDGNPVGGAFMPRDHDLEGPVDHDSTNRLD